MWWACVSVCMCVCVAVTLPAGRHDSELCGWPGRHSPVLVPNRITHTWLLYQHSCRHPHTRRLPSDAHTNIIRRHGLGKPSFSLLSTGTDADQKFLRVSKVDKLKSVGMSKRFSISAKISPRFFFVVGRASQPSTKLPRFLFSITQSLC